MQITNGIRSILSYAPVYLAFQTLMGARKGWRRITNDYLKMEPGQALLDVGCGPADILSYLPAVKYWGFDISQDYVARARAKYGASGHFICKHLDESDLTDLPKFDAALMSGVLHHLDDDEANFVLNLISRALKPGGKLVTVDPCLVPGQNPIARYLIGKDRGRNVRIETSYQRLMIPHFEHVETEVVHKAWIPYTYCFSVCRISGVSEIMRTQLD